MVLITDAPGDRSTETGKLSPATNVHFHDHDSRWNWLLEIEKSGLFSRGTCFFVVVQRSLEKIKWLFH